MTGLHDLAEAAGLQIAWEDALGEPHRVADESLVAILAALGFPADSDAAIADSTARIARDHAIDCAFVSGIVDTPIALPARCGAPGPATLILEDGTRREIVLKASGDRLTVPAIASIGYHRLTVGEHEITVAVAPPRCFSVADA